MNPWQNRLLWLSAFALFAGIPLSKAVSSFGMGLLGISAIILVLQNGSPKPESKYKPLFGLGIFYIFYLISCLYSTSIITGLDETLRQHAFITIPLCFWIVSDWLLPRLVTLMQVFVAACTFHCLCTIGLFILPESIVSEFVGQFPFLQPYPDLTDRLKFGLYTPFLERLNLAYLVGFGLLYLLYDGLKHGWRSTNIIQGGILFSAFTLIGARGAQLAFLAGLGFGGLSYLIDWIKSLGLPQEEYRQRLTSAITILIIGLMIAPYIAYKTVPAVKKRYDQMKWELRLIDNGEYKNEAYQYFTSLTRIRAWQNAITLINEKPILGVGIGDYDSALAIANSVYDDKVPTHNQNFFLYVWGASGLLSLIVFILGLWRYTRSFWSKTQYSIRHLALAYIVFVIMSCMIDAFLKYHIGSIGVMMILSSMFMMNLHLGNKES